MALLYGLYKLAFSDPGFQEPQEKLQPLPVPDYQPNRQHQNVSIISNGKSSINDDPRNKYYGGFLKGAWTLGLSVLLDDAPDPTHHWGVLVGDYVHQLGIDNGYNYYHNDKFSEYAGWTKYKIGVTKFNDVAVRNAGMNAMNEMPEVYNLLDNNCQSFTIRLLDKILRDGRKKLKTINHQYMSGNYVEARYISVGHATTRVRGGVGGGGGGGSGGYYDGDDHSWLESVSVNDKDGHLAIVRDEDAHSKVLDAAVITMINNTPTVKEARIVG